MKWTLAPQMRLPFSIGRTRIKAFGNESRIRRG
jgi:hypothetical protein